MKPFLDPLNCDLEAAFRGVDSACGGNDSAPPVRPPVVA